MNSIENIEPKRYLCQRQKPRDPSFYEFNLDIEYSKEELKKRFDYYMSHNAEINEDFLDIEHADGSPILGPWWLELNFTSTWENLTIEKIVNILKDIGEFWGSFCNINILITPNPFNNKTFNEYKDLLLNKWNKIGICNVQFHINIIGINLWEEIENQYKKGTLSNEFIKAARAQDINTCGRREEREESIKKLEAIKKNKL